MKPFKRRVRPVDSDWHDEVMYLGVIDILKTVSPGGSVLIVLDDLSICEQLNGKRIYNALCMAAGNRLRVLRKDVRKLAQERDLELQVEYVRPWNHLASKLIKSWLDSRGREQ